MPLSCEIVEKRGFGARFVRGWDTPDFGHEFSNRTYFRPTMWPDMVEFRSASSEIRGRKNKERQTESVVKPKSAGPPTTMSGGLIK